MGLLKYFALTLALASASWGFAPKVAPMASKSMLQVCDTNAPVLVSSISHRVGFLVCVWVGSSLTQLFSLYICIYRQPKVKYPLVNWMVPMFELESFVPDGMMNMSPIWSRDAKKH